MNSDPKTIFELLEYFRNRINDHERKMVKMDKWDEEIDYARHEAKKSAYQNAAEKLAKILALSGK